jgi:hypothetical protein
MSKKAKKKARAKGENEPDDGTEIYEEGEEGEWEDDEPQGTPHVSATGDQPVYEIRGPATPVGEAPPDPKDQPPEEPNYDLSPNQTFNKKAGMADPVEEPTDKTDKRSTRKKED